MKTFFWYSSSVYSCHLFLISSASVRSIPSLSFIEPIFAWNVSLVSLIFLEISSLSHSIVSLYFFALITQEGFLISPCYSLELCIQMGISFLPLPLAYLFTAICKASSDLQAFCTAKKTIRKTNLDGETMETVTDFIFLGWKITVDGDCSHEIKRRLFLRRKVMII